MCISLASTFDTRINEEVINHTAFSNFYEDEVLIAFFPLANFFAQSEFFISIWSLTLNHLELIGQRQKKNSLGAKKFASGKPA